MTFADFSLESAVQRSELTLPPRAVRFADVPALELPPILQAAEGRWMPQDPEVNTEKGRSERIVAPILMEATHVAGQDLGVDYGART